MKALLLALCLAASACGVASANETRHSAIVDMPEVTTLTHASPDTWYTLPPVQPMSQHRLRHPISDRHWSLDRVVLLNRAATQSTYLGPRLLT
jgi:hypothetical protein